MVKPVEAPAPFVDLKAIGFGAIGDDVTPASASNPLPVTDEALVDAMTTPISNLPPTPISDGSDFSGVAIDFTSSSDQAIVAAVTAQRVRVYRARLCFSGACNLEIWDGPSASGTKKETIQVPSAGILVLDIVERAPYWSTTAGNALVLKCSSASVRVTGRLTYTQAA